MFYTQVFQTMIQKKIQFNGKAVENFAGHGYIHRWTRRGVVK